MSEHSTNGVAVQEVEAVAVAVVVPEVDTQALLRESEKLIAKAVREYVKGTQGALAGVLECGKLAHAALLARMASDPAHSKGQRAKGVDLLERELLAADATTDGKADVSRILGVTFAYQHLAADTGLLEKKDGKAGMACKVSYHQWHNAWARLVERVDADTPAEHWELLAGFEDECRTTFWNSLDKGWTTAMVKDEVGALCNRVAQERARQAKEREKALAEEKRRLDEERKAKEREAEEARRKERETQEAAKAVTDEAERREIERQAEEARRERQEIERQAKEREAEAERTDREQRKAAADRANADKKAAAEQKKADKRSGLAPAPVRAKAGNDAPPTANLMDVAKAADPRDLGEALAAQLLASKDPSAAVVAMVRCLVDATGIEWTDDALEVLGGAMTAIDVIDGKGPSYSEIAAKAAELATEAA